MLCDESIGAALCRIALPIPEQLQQDWKKVILLTLARREEPVRKSGSIALAAYDAGYGLSPDELEQYPLYTLHALYIVVLTDNNEGLRSGIADAIGLLPAKTLEAYHTRICQLLYTIASGKAKLFDVDTRRNAMRSYAKVFQVIGSKMSIEEFHDMLDAMLSGFGDYTVDIHGDVGSRVRELVCGIGASCHLVATTQQQQQQQPHLSTLSEALQSDTARKDKSYRVHAAIAGQVLVTLLYKSDLEIAGRTQLTEAIPRDEAIEWISAEASLLTGIITSGSGMAGNVTGAAIKELTSYVCSLPRADEETSQENKWTADQLVELIQVIGTEHTDNERILQSLYEVLAAVLDAGFAQQLTESAKRLLLKMTNQRFVACRNVQKAKPCIQIYCGLMPEDISDPLWESVLRRLLDCLFHQSSRIRQNTSELLYLCLMGLGVDDIIEDEENNDGTVEECLLATQWDSPLTELKPVCLQLHHMLKVTPTDRLKKRMKLDMPNTS
ncbi:hypothetical protein BDF22DRAFT_745304 [Syncephalis plumigaleata]|nr:hypothetical protein BDF22DRAFT_745304 [Syncephalis plumigaleata]